jgi:urea transport system permease protein
VRRLAAAHGWAWGVGLLVVAAAIVFPLTKDDPYWYTVLTTALVYGVLALSLDVLWGYTGILNLAPAATFGLGAYAWGIVGTRVGGERGIWLALLAAILVPAATAALVALVSLWAGAREIYFALVTLALGLVLEQAATVWTGVTGGSNGLLGIPWPTFGGKTFTSPSDLYFLTLGATAAAFLLCLGLVRGRVGAVLAAIRESDTRAETLGYSTLRYRVLASAISGALGGLAGMLYAPTTGIVDPSVFGVVLSVQVFVWVAVGGQGTLYGPLAAAILISVGQQTLTGSSATAYLLAIASLFLVIVLFLPGGLASLPRLVLRARRGRPPGVRAEPVEGRP